MGLKVYVGVVEGEVKGATAPTSSWERRSEREGWRGRVGGSKNDRSEGEGERDILRERDDE